MKHLNIILIIIIIWYIIDTHFLFSGIPILLIPFPKVSFLKEKILDMANPTPKQKHYKSVWHDHSGGSSFERLAN
ncbi:MAG TPA: hypothetical protein VGK46_07260 [Saprospiraceae bacterium]